uniref:Uncharacterized protein n=1 Tax=Anopheles minimus TaxID=112268 RepID=A0A182WN45_9DIPT
MHLVISPLRTYVVKSEKETIIVRAE